VADVCNLQKSKSVQAVDFVFFDSGTGGIPYMLYLKQKSPQSACIYAADTRNFPYGEKSGGEIARCASDTVRLILRRFTPRTFIIACNTVSVTALGQLRAAFPAIPFVGTVPAINQAAAVTKNKRIGLLATQRTVDEPYTADLASRFAPDCTLIKRADPALIEFIEHDFFTASPSDKKAAVKPAVDFFAEQEADTIILGCTHFLHMADTIAEAAGTNVRIVDSKEGVVNQALRMCTQRAGAGDSGCKSPRSDDCTFFISGSGGADEKSYKVLAEKLKIPYGGSLTDI